MTFHRAAFRRGLFVLAALATVSALSGCLYDTSSMNVDRFRMETAPVFYQPQITQPVAGRPLPGAVAVDNTKAPDQTELHQTYGLPTVNPVHTAAYGVTADEGHTLPAIPYKQIDQRYLRQVVDYPSSEKSGTIVVDTSARYLYLVQPGGKALRYGVGIGRDGFAWSGRGSIQWKQKWPRWTPPDEMVARQPELKQFAAANGGMNPGLNNPLGARALYIFRDGKDTFYRIHGTPDWKSIGKATSSGCVRMLNQDVIDLYEHVSDKTPIVVL